MTFISYAQNFEDLILWRALNKIERGFYIDVGACEPDVYSVTKAFSDRGWHGINIEPNPAFLEQLSVARSNDVNLGLALGDHPGTVTINVIEGTGLSTADAEIARKHGLAGWASVAIEVEMQTLAQVWAQHVPPGQPVHFLKVDVEGFEKAVLAGADWSHQRPWIVVVEATAPLSQIETHDEWEHLLTQAGYEHVYSDGLNRFYLDSDHGDLRAAFRYPPNIFDGFETTQLVEARRDADEIKAALNIAESDAAAKAENQHREFQSIYKELETAKSNALEAEQAHQRAVTALVDESNMAKSAVQEVELVVRRELLYQTERAKALVVTHDRATSRFRDLTEAAERKWVEAERQVAQQRQALDAISTQLAHANRHVHAAQERSSLEAALVVAQQQAAAISNEYQSVINSTAWRATGPMRRLLTRLPSQGKAQARRVLKAGWWALTPWKMPERIRFLERRSLLQATASTASLTASTTDISMPGGVPVFVRPNELGNLAASQYAEWIQTIEQRSPAADLPVLEEPVVSFVICGPVSFERMARTAGSIRAQRQANWQIVLAPVSDAAELPASYLELVNADERIETVEPGIDRAEALKAATGKASGAYISVLDNGDLLSASALDELAHVLVKAPGADIVYSDEDELSAESYRSNPYFKPSWSPDLLYAFNYFGRLTFLRRELVEAVGGFDPGSGDGAEWDLNLRVSDRAQSIERIAKVNCHRAAGGHRERPPADSEQAADRRRVVETYWLTNGMPGSAQTDSQGTQHVLHKFKTAPRVSIIIPTKNKTELLRMCLEGLLHATNYSNKEIVIVDTGSDDPITLSYYGQLANVAHLKIVHFDKVFNYSAACNFGARFASGELLLFLNNDIEIISSDWLSEMVGFAMRPGVGVVGTKLIYPSTELQHGGVAIGIHLAALMYRSAGGRPWGLFGSPEHARNWLAIMGACQLVRRDVFERLEGFDESYRIAMSDVALCMRAWQAGYRTAYAPRACLVHHEGATRGNTNPSEDIRRLADDIQLLGLGEDPYLHPELDGHRAIPTLRIQNAPSVREILAIRVREDGSAFPIDPNAPLASDGSFLRNAELQRDDVFWKHQDTHKVADAWSAARWCLDLLRTDRSIRTRFPKALTEGKDGSFAHYIRERGGWPGTPETRTRLLDEMFALNLGAATRQVFLFREDVRIHCPLGLTPLGWPAALRWFLRHGQGEADLRLEDIWWLYTESNENPEREVLLAWSFTPHWQALYPDGLTVFGRGQFSRWLRSTYRIDALWADSANWPLTGSAAQQIRLAYNACSPWRERFPSAMDNARDAVKLIEWLQADSETLDPSAKDWLANLNKKEVTEELTRLGLNVLGHFSYPSGLRVSVEALVEGLHRVGVATSLRDIRTDKNDDPNHVNFNGSELFDVTLIHTQPEPFFDQAFERANLHPRLPAPYRIAYWYWEFDSVPTSWTDQAAKVDELWAATEFVARGLRERFSIPVRTLFPGVRLGEYKRRPKADFGLKDTEFTFLFTFHMMSIMERKNPLGLIRAFRLAFEPAQKVRLVLKTSFGDRHPAQIEELRSAARGHNITIIDKVFSPDEVLSLMDTCDAYVSLHRSEGLGLTIAEAMLMAKPVIATNYSGNVDFMNEANSLPVPFELVKLGRPIPPYDAEAVWAEPSTSEAANLMQRVFSDQEWARDLGRRAKENAEANLSLEAAGQAIAARLAEISAIRQQLPSVDTPVLASASSPALACGSPNGAVEEVSRETTSSAPQVSRLSMSAPANASALDEPAA